MRDVRVLHHEVVVAHDSDVAVLAAAMDGRVFAKDVSIADFHRARDAGVGEILRLVANHRAGVKYVVSAELGDAENRNVAYQAGARAEADFSVEQAERPDLDAGGQLDVGTHHRSRMNPRRRVTRQLSSLRFFRSS